MCVPPSFLQPWPLFAQIRCENHPESPEPAANASSIHVGCNPCLTSDGLSGKKLNKSKSCSATPRLNLFKLYFANPSLGSHCELVIPLELSRAWRRPWSWVEGAVCALPGHVLHQDVPARWAQLCGDGCLCFVLLLHWAGCWGAAGCWRYRGFWCELRRSFFCLPSPPFLGVPIGSAGAGEEGAM